MFTYVRVQIAICRSIAVKERRNHVKILSHRCATHATNFYKNMPEIEIYDNDRVAATGTTRGSRSHRARLITQTLR